MRKKGCQSPEYAGPNWDTCGKPAEPYQVTYSWGATTMVWYCPACAEFKQKYEGAKLEKVT